MKFSSLSMLTVLSGLVISACSKPSVVASNPSHADSGTTPIPQPPAISVLKSSPLAEHGLIFVAPKAAGINASGAPGPVGPEIVDDQGRPVWFLPITNGQVAADFRVQQYHQRPVLTWAQQRGFGGLAQGESVNYILDRAYHVVATVRAGNGLNADAHEFLLTPQDTALITIYSAVPRDLSALGGSKSAQVIEGVVQEIDVATGRVLLEWHSLSEIGLDESYQPLPPSAATPWDYFHHNSVSLDSDGNILISARHTSAVYKIDRRTGHIIWRLGGKRSDFVLGSGERFSSQHDAREAGNDTIRLFDNESNGKAVLPASRIVWIRRHPSAKTATLLRSVQHPDGLSVASQGNAQAIDHGHLFVGWGQVGRLSEFDEKGSLLFDASVPHGYDTYRAYRFHWEGAPDTKPTATAQRQPDGRTLVHAVWNGATEVVRWDVLDESEADDQGRDGGSRDSKHPVASGDWNGLDTTISFGDHPARVAVVARDIRGGEIGRSSVVPVSP